MSGRWLGIRVDLIGGRGQILDPPPGRAFAVPPSCTFDDFGRGIDLAFARWDLSHLWEFTLDDATLVVNEEMADELRASAFGGAIPRTMLLSAKVSPRLKVGSRFATFSIWAMTGRTPVRSKATSIPSKSSATSRTSRPRTGAGERCLINMGGDGNRTGLV
jgi:hypothetical protein